MQGKTLLIAFLTISTTLGLTGGYFFLENIEGKTSKAALDMAEDNEIKTIYWDFGDGERTEGRIAKHIFEEGKHNLTATVVRTNGEKEVYKRQIKIGR